MAGQRAAFLDRDGTINEEVGYLDRIEKLRILPGAIDAIGMLNRGGLKVVVVTNQSGIARGLFNEAFVEKTHRHLQDLLHERGARIDGFYFCPHHPTEGLGPYRLDCPCRKPKPGLLIRAAAEMGLALEDSFMIGDMPKDVEAGIRAGARGILVRTGYGREVPALPEAAYIAEDLSDAAHWILGINRS
ncbi:MAG: D,D-heptose 1,7-bisphosphate phosphatase [Deltaproteobacteria bacterium HGW-Deltaproteobacteria-19]|jgi:D,D-heptose 1,7-bisphosphate phosphatase|nr:MAG: D,D-heptose 1,7-bisphosphate phosphatase [Deltaproteobacteria bacterium HGW-Deltaproteobacteria-19]